MSAQPRRLRTLLEFASRSMGQPYGKAFLRRVALRHPCCTSRGIMAYSRTLTQESTHERRLAQLDARTFAENASSHASQLLVATGFCQKPLRAAGDAHDCPSGRFSHDCTFLSRLSRQSHGALHPACRSCDIRVLGHATLLAGGCFAVLASALDIAYDILLSALEERRYRHILLATCLYSLEPLSLALLCCGLDGHIFTYQTGDCASYAQWQQADNGHKPQRTTLAPQSRADMLHLLGMIASRRRAQPGAQPTHYEQRHHVFQPV